MQIYKTQTSKKKKTKRLNCNSSIDDILQSHQWPANCNLWNPFFLTNYGLVWALTEGPCWVWMQGDGVSHKEEEKKRNDYNNFIHTIFKLVVCLYTSAHCGYTGQGEWLTFIVDKCFFMLYRHWFSWELWGLVSPQRMPTYWMHTTVSSTHEGPRWLTGAQKLFIQ